MNEFPHSYMVLVDSSETIDDSVYRSEFDSGFIKQAPKSTRIMRKRNVEYTVCSRDEYNRFLKWFTSEIKRTQYFLWQDYLDNKKKRARIISGTLSAKPVNKYFESWNITFTLETWESY